VDYKLIIDYSIRIGIFYNNKEWAEQKLEEIYKDIANSNGSGTCRRLRCEGIGMIDLGNGSYIKFVPADDHSRGHRFNRIYYQEGVDEEFLIHRVYPALLNHSPLSLK